VTANTDVSAAVNALPALSDVVAHHGLRAKKSLGQHFLFDLNLTSRIARLAAPLEQAAVIEVGPGPGALTRALLTSGAAKVIAIEKDPRFIPALEEISAAAPGRLVIIEGDALRVDETALLAEHAPGLTPCVVSNLPYNIGTPLLIKWLSTERWWSVLVLMFQKEVAARITAHASDDAYGRLAVLSQLRANPEWGFDVPAEAFTPPPKVDSGVVRIGPRDDAFADVTAIERVTAAAFGQRRKIGRAHV